MNKNKWLLGAAVAGILGAGLAQSADAKKAAAKKDEPKTSTETASDELVPCYGINKCSGHGKCGQESHACAGMNACKGQGWIKVPKDTCEEIQGGSLKPIPKG